MRAGLNILLIDTLSRLEILKWFIANGLVRILIAEKPIREVGCRGLGAGMRGKRRADAAPCPFRRVAAADCVVCVVIKKRGMVARPRGKRYS